ncbi:TPA: hypothetical protein ACXK4S_000685 [Pseudomonas aeruginosa]
MRLIIALLLLLSFSSAFASKEEFIDRYKDVGLENGEIIADYYVHPFNETLHFWFRLLPGPVDDLARANGIIEKDDSLWNYYTEHEQKIFKERAEEIQRVLFVIWMFFSYIAFSLSCITACHLLEYHLAGEAEGNEEYDKLLFVKTLFFAMLGLCLMLPNTYNGNANLITAIGLQARFIGFGGEQFVHSGHMATHQRDQFILDTTNYEGKSENAIANYIALGILNNSLVYLQSEKEFHRNTHTNKIYEHPEKFVHVENETIQFYMTPDTHDYLRNSMLLYSGGSIALGRIKLDEKTAEKIYPVQIIPTSSESEIASGWKVYEAELKKKFADKYEDSATYIKIASLYFHYNSYLNALENKIVELTPTKGLKAAEYVEALACETETDRRFDARKALENNLFERNYCLMKNGNSIVLTPESGNSERAVQIITEISSEINSLLLTANKSLYESTKMTFSEKVLIEALQKGTGFFFRNEARIKQNSLINNQLARYLNNSVTVNNVGEGFFIDDSNLESRVNNGNPLNLNLAYEEVTSQFTIIPNDFSDFNISKRAENYTSSKSSADEQSDTSTLFSAVMSIRKRYEENYNLNNAGDTERLHDMLDQNIAAQNFGTSLIATGVDIIKLKIGLGIIGGKSAIKGSQASAKNQKGMSLVDVKNIITGGFKKLIAFAQNIFSALDGLAFWMIFVGLFFTVVIPNIVPITHFMAEQGVLLNQTVLILFPALIALRLFNKNDKDNWQYIYAAFRGFFLSLLFLKLMVDICFILISVVSNYVAVEFLQDVYSMIVINTDSSNPADIALSAITFLFFACMFQWIILTLTLKMFFSMMISFIQALQIHDDFLDFALRALKFIDVVLSILCPLIWIFNLVNKKKPKVDGQSKDEEETDDSQAQAKQKESKEEPKPATV